MIKKSHKKYPKTFAYTRHVLKFGNFGFKTTTATSLTKEQLFSFERALQKKTRSLMSTSKEYKFWCLLSTNSAVTKLNLESRMGKGKGAISTEDVFVKPGCIIYELQNVKLQYVLELFAFLKKQIPANLILVRDK
nr:ribosomal protein L16 [Phymatolithon calcareum]